MKTSLDAAPLAAVADIPRTLSPAGDRTLLEVSQMRDPVGVLSVYADAAPERARGTRPGWQLAAENALRSLRTRLDAEVPADRARFLRARFASFEQMTEAFLYARGLGRGRALFLPLGGGTPIAVASQMRLQDLVVLDERAHVGPLLAAYDVGRPLGIAVLSQARVRILEQRFGQTHELETSDFQLARATPAELRGRGLGNSSVPQPTGADTDRLRHSTEARRARLLERVGDRLGGLGAERGWGLLALCGDPRLSAPVHSRLSSELQVVTAPQSLERLSPAAVAEAIAPKLEQARVARHVTLAHQVLDGAASAGPATLGLSQTLQALNEGRVAHLLLDMETERRGWIFEDGRLAATGELLLGSNARPEREEPHLNERMLARALETAADITPLGPEAAALLTPHQSVGAVLRW